jgi:hypothetical protein
MRVLFIVFIFSIRLLHSQADSNSSIGRVNNPNVEYQDVQPRFHVTVEPTNRNEPSFIKMNYHGRDTTFELVYDPTYNGTAEELHKAMAEGLLEKYYVIEQDGRLYEHIKPLPPPQASLLEEYWMYGAVILIAAGFIFYRIAYTKRQAKANDGDGATEDKNELPDGH